MDTSKQQIVERLKTANNVLVTVSANPSVDQLAGAIGFSLLLNKLGKHATAVFSGEVPSVLEFLQPDKTIEKTTDSLRDFIISLDKSKADKLRYKVEDEHVKIFITPYKTSISQADLEFSQGDFNVDVVVALGVREQAELDEAITAHGRILHGATVVSLTTDTAGSLGSINWVDSNASSLSEMLTALSEMLQSDALDGQMATAYLTGIVAETERFSNHKTTSATMALSAKLMSAGANQQLVAEQLQPKPAPFAAPEPQADNPEVTPPSDEPEISDPEPVAAPVPDPDGSLLISHEQSEPQANSPDTPPVAEAHIDESGAIAPISEPSQPASDFFATAEDPELGPLPARQPVVNRRERVILPPTHDEPQSAQSFDTMFQDVQLPPLAADQPGPAQSVSPVAPGEQTAAEPLPKQPDASFELPPITPLASNVPVSEPAFDPAAQPIAEPLPPIAGETQTLADLEHAVDSPHVQPADASGGLDGAREAVADAVNAMPGPLPPIAALNAQPVDLQLHDDAQPASQASTAQESSNGSSDESDRFAMPPLETQEVPVAAPPPVPPPMMPDFSLPPLTDAQQSDQSPTPR